MFFFFQAEDGIRDWSVTGVQTCALPIFAIGFAMGLVTRVAKNKFLRSNANIQENISCDTYIAVSMILMLE